MANVFWGLGAAGAGESASQRASTDMSARAAASHAREAQRETMFIEKRLDKLTLICMALWSLLSEKVGGLSEEDLMERVKQIDLMDGEADGKLQRQVAKCSACGRVMSPRHSKCLYCGADRLQITAFDDVI